MKNSNGRIYPKELYKKYLDDYLKRLNQRLRRSERKEKLKKIKNIQ
jgi:hypothetical protein